MLFSVSFAKFLRILYLKKHVYPTAFVWVVFLENVLRLKFCFKTITSAKTARTTTEGLQKSKNNKEKMNNLKKFVEFSQYLKYYKVFTSSHLKVLCKSVFKNCAKKTPSQDFPCEFYAIFMNTYICRTSVKICFGI